MAVELCSESSSAGISPRISFSHDLCLSDIVPIEQHPLRPNSSSSVDFDFCTRKSFDQDSSSADELFSDGKILPTEIKKKTVIPGRQADRSSIPHPAKVLDDHDPFSSFDDSPRKEGDQEKQSSKSFWRFKRSSSLNCGSGYGRTLCPLPLLSRSNSTGSSPSVKRSPLSKDGQGSTNYNQKQNKQGSIRSPQAISSSSTNHQKPPLKKHYGNGVRVNPVINVPSGNLFGLGSIFFNGKEKSNKKK